MIQESDINFKFRYHIGGKTESIRVAADTKYRIERITRTKKNSSGQPGKAVTTYALSKTPTEYDTLAEVLKLLKP